MMALSNSIRMIRRRGRERDYLNFYLQLSVLASFVLAAIGFVRLGSLAEAHDKLPNRPQRRHQPPAIYTIADIDGDSGANTNDNNEYYRAIMSHRLSKPYSWNNQRLAKQLVLDQDKQWTLSNTKQTVPEFGLAPDEDSNRSNNRDEEQQQQQQLGDMSPMLDYSAKSASNKRWRPPVGKTAPTSHRRASPSVGHGTKGRGASGQGATKTTEAAAPQPGTKSIRGRQSPRNSINNRSHHHASPVVPDTEPLPDDRNVTTRGSRGQPRKNLVCYYGTWAVYRPDAGKFSVEDIDPFLCTHVIYGFTGLSYDNLIKPLDPWNDLEDNYGKGAMKRFTNLKRINPDLKTLVAIGGWNEGSIKYSKMASEPASRARFIESVVKFLNKYNFDGLDLDWEYPGSRGGASYDKQNFVALLRELSAALKPSGHLLTAAVSAGKWFIDPAYNIAEVAKYLDLINLMAYDYHGGWETKTGMNAPLFGSARHDLSREELQLNVNWSVNYWLAQGAPRDKIMLGVGSYGRSFTLDRAQVNGINAPASQKGQAGPYTREPGSLGYNELCELFQRQPNAWTIVRDPDYLAPYAYSDRQWVGYDDKHSLALKAQYAKSMGLGGMMMWSIETDDFHGRCHNEKYPLLNTIRRVLDGNNNNNNNNQTGGGSGGSTTGTVQPPAQSKPQASTTTTTTTTTTSTTKRPIGGGGGVQPSSSSRRPTLVQPVSTARPTAISTTPGRGEVEDDDNRPTATGTSSTRRPGGWPSSTTSTSTTTTSRKPRPRPTSTSTTSRPVPPNVVVVVGPSKPKPKPTSGQFECQAEGMFANPANCRKFIRCVSLGTTNQFQRYNFDCAPGTAFNAPQGYCDHIYNVPSCNVNNNKQQQASSADDDRQTQAKPVAATPTSNSDLNKQQQRLQQHHHHHHPAGYFNHQFTVHHQW